MNVCPKGLELNYKFINGVSLLPWPCMAKSNRGKYNVRVGDSEPIRLLESPRSLSVHILAITIQ